MNKGTAIVGFVVALLAGLLLMWGVNRSSKVAPSADPATWSDADAPIPVTSNDPVWGNRSAPVTLVVFSEFQCPYCARVEKTFESLKAQYGPEKIRIVWKSRPLRGHPNARPASTAAETVRALAGNEAFWKFHKLAFANQNELTRENFEKWAQQAGVDLEKFKAELDKNTYAAKVSEDEALGDRLGVRGTPHTFINGIQLSGAVPIDQFKELISAELVKAEAMVKAGTSPDKVYVEATKNNHKAPAAAAEPPKQPERREPPVDTTVWNVPVDKSPVRGAADALVTIVVFSEFQCPYCARVEPTLQQLLKDYEGKLRIVWKDRPLDFHERAVPAALFAAEARKQKGDAGFWAAHDLLFENQTKLDMDSLEGYAKTLGLNWPKVKKAIEDQTYMDAIEADIELGDSIRAAGTPHMFINGRRLSGARPIEVFKQLIDEQLTKAEALVSEGTAKGKVYETIMKDAKTPEPPPPPERKDVPAPTASNPWKGAKNGKIIMQVFSDFECPYCSRLNPTIAQILEKFGKNVKIVWHNLPLDFHKKAKLAAEASMEVYKQKGDTAFWKYHDKLFENQRALDRADLEKYAEELGCDMTKFKEALDNHTHAAAVEADMAIAQKAGIRGTPAAVINGYFVSGAQGFGAFKKVIKLAEADLKAGKK